MSGGRQPLSPAEARELGEQRESWCAVELQKEQSWCRKERQHSDEILKSTVFDVHRPEFEPRCTFQPNTPTHRERRHFDQQCRLPKFDKTYSAKLKYLFVTVLEPTGYTA